MDSQQLKNIIEAALLAAGGPLTLDQLRALFGDSEQDCPEKAEIREALKELTDDYATRGIEIREVASGFRVQVREEMARWLTKLWEDRPPRYSRALMETLAIIAYRQPVTRGDIEEIRGVSVTSNIIRTLLERDWIKVVGHRDVPGKPAMFGSTRGFLDYFGLKKLDDFPPQAELAAMEPVALQLELGTADQEPSLAAQAEAAPSEQELSGQEQADASATEDADSENVSDAGVVAQSDGDATDTHLVEESESSLDDEDELDALDDDFLASAIALADSANNDFTTSGQAPEPEAEFEQAVLEQDGDSSGDVAPGAVAPLVGLNAPGADQPEPTTVASLDDARAAAADAQSADAPDADHAEDSHEADVVPIKNS
jgi:segregation and condensation protein B